VQSSRLVASNRFKNRYYSGRFHLHFSALAATLTRNRKVAAEDAFRCESGAPAHCSPLSLRSSFLPSLSYFRDDMKNEGGKLAAENFVGENDEK